MRIKGMVLVWAASLALCGAAKAHDIQIHDGQCGYSTDFDVHITQDGINFWRDTGRPGKVVMHDGHLSVDGRDVVVSTDDAARLRDYETQVRSLLPEVAEIAREGVNIGFAAMRAVLLDVCRERR